MLSRRLSPAIVLFLCTAAVAAERTAILTVPAQSLVFAGEGLQPPDAEGHFAIGVRLPVAHLHATRCDTPTLIVGMGTMNKPPDALTAADQRDISRNIAVYESLKSASSRGGAVSLPLRNESRYLTIEHGTVDAPFCTVSMDESQAPWSNPPMPATNTSGPP